MKHKKHKQANDGHMHIATAKFDVSIADGPPEVGRAAQHAQLK